MELTRTQDRRSGMAMVEMVIVLPLLLMMLFGVVEFGVMFGQWQTVTNAAREGARTAVVFRGGCVPATVENEVRSKVKRYASAAGVALSDADIAVSGACGASDTDATVTVTHPYDFHVLPGFVQSLGPSMNLVGDSSMRNEGSS